MINLAPIAAAPQPASQSPASAGNGTGSESTFESIFDRSVAARRQSSPQSTTDTSASPKSTAKTKTTSQAEADTQITQAETTEIMDADAAPADDMAAVGSDAGPVSQAASAPGKSDREPQDRVSPQSVLTDGIAGNGATVYLLNNLNAAIDPASIAVETSDQKGALVSKPEGAASQIRLQITQPGNGAAIGGAEMAATPVIAHSATAVGRAEAAVSPVMPDMTAVVSKAEIAASPVMPDKTAAVGKAEVAATTVLPDKTAAVAKAEVAATTVLPDKTAAVGKPEAAASPVMPDKTAVVGTTEVTATPVIPDSNVLVTKATAQFTVQPATLTPAAENPAAQAVPSGSITPAASSDQPAPPAATQHLSAQLLDLLNNKEPGAATNAARPMTGAGLQGPDNVVSGLQFSQLSTAPAAQGQQQPAPTDTSPLMASLTQLTSLKEPVSQAPGKSSSPPVHPSQLHTNPEQLLEAKIDAQRTDDGKQQQQPAKQEMAGTPQLPTTHTTVSPTADQTMTFSQVSQSIMSQQPVPTAPVTTSQPATPPAAAPIYEESVLNQVAERLQMQLNNRETQLNIKLHPAELGRLDISLTVKEGSIRAHVVAQSGQVQELLEKNMTRLKAMLEGQGFTIEELRVSTRPESIDNSDLFQDQLAGGRTAAAHGSHKTDTSFGETFEDVITTFGTTTRGVNITA